MPTYLDENSEVVVGDHHLIGVTAAHTAGRLWPPSAGIPEGVGLDAFGYVSDDEVTVRVVDALEREPHLLFVQLNGPDTAAPNTRTVRISLHWQTGRDRHVERCSRIDLRVRPTLAS